MAAERLRGLYGIADTGLLSESQFEPAVIAALAGGAAVLQYRDKSDDQAKRLKQARLLVAHCTQAGALSIINDDVALALEVSAHGVHLGREDGAVAAARERLGPQRLIGRSCYDSLTAAQQAQAEGADYVAFGAFYSSSIKPNAVPAPLDLLTAAKAALNLPVVAIGGITLDNAAPLVDRGADMVAVISALFGADDIEAEAELFSELFS